MDKNIRTKKSLQSKLSLAVGALTLACLMQSCGGISSTPQQSTESNPQETSASTVDTSQPNEATTQAPVVEQSPSTEALRSYYEKLIANLRQQLSEEKENRYISDTEYKLKLEELQATVAALEEALKKDTPTGGEATEETKGQEAVTQPETQAPEEEQSPVAFTYRVVDGQAHITGYTGGGTTVHVPTEIEGYTVVAIDDSAFQNSPIRVVVLPGSVTTVGWFAFSGCFELELVTLPASVSKINYGAFDNCPSLTLLCPADSYAEAYAISFGLTYRYV